MERWREIDGPEMRKSATISPAASSPASDIPAGGGRRAGRNGRPVDPSSFGFAVWQLKDGEDKVIADRLVEIFSTAAKA